MPSGLLDWALGIDSHKAGNYSISPGVVLDNSNVLLEARVQVHIPALPSFDPWARVVSVGAGQGRGFMWIPQIGDEVLVAFNQNDERDAYILGGLWGTVDRPPTVIPTDFLSKRIIQTGMVPGVGHTVEFDDALQAIKITTTTKQQITLDPTKVEISTTAGAQKITLDLSGASITIQALVGNIELKAPLGNISLEAMNVELHGVTSVEVKSDLDCTVKGMAVNIN